MKRIETGFFDSAVKGFCEGLEHFKQRSMRDSMRFKIELLVSIPFQFQWGICTESNIKRNKNSLSVPMSFNPGVGSVLPVTDKSL